MPTKTQRKPSPGKRANRQSKIFTLNVNYTRGSGGKRIDASLYGATKRAILASLPKSGKGLTLIELYREVAEHAPKALFTSRSVEWYVTTVKLDLEARGLIRRVVGARPQRLLRVR